MPNKKNIISQFFDGIDLGKKFPNYVDKRIFRAAFVIILIIQMTALTMTGFNFSPVWVECDLSKAESSLTDFCENPLYRARGSFCEQDYRLCTQATLSEGETFGNKPPTFVFMANPLSWLCLFIAALANHSKYKAKKYFKEKQNGKRIQN